jgi:hypothetical protein
MSTRATAGRDKKTPTACRLGSNTTATPPAPFPSKGSPVEIQAGVLARGIHLLSAPSQGFIPQWFSQISFRSQLRGSAGLAPASLLTAPCCEATWLSSNSQLSVQLTTIVSVLQDKFAPATWRVPSRAKANRSARVHHAKAALANGNVTVGPPCPYFTASLAEPKCLLLCLFCPILP